MAVRQSMELSGTGSPRKVVVVADPTRESAGALQYALSHVVVDPDELILLHVDNPFSWKNTLSTLLKRPSIINTTAPFEAVGGGEVDFLEEMKNACQTAQPKVRVRLVRVEVIDGKERANTILSQSNRLGADILVIGQRKSLSTALLGHKRPGGSLRGAKVLDTAEYLIENSKCICVGVQKKGQNAGYLLNSRIHRNFWLLA